MLYLYVRDDTECERVGHKPTLSRLYGLFSDQIKRGNGDIMSKIEQITVKLAEPIAAQIGCEVIEAEYKKEGSDYHLRVYIDKEDGYVGIDDCEYVSRALETELDKADPIKDAYCLEVCSPGLDRQLKRDKDFVRFMNCDVDIKLFAAYNGKKEYTGVLVGYDNGAVRAECDDGSVIEFNKNDAAYIKLAVKF